MNSLRCRVWYFCSKKHDLIVTFVNEFIEPLEARMSIYHGVSCMYDEFTLHPSPCSLVYV